MRWSGLEDHWRRRRIYQWVPVFLVVVGPVFAVVVESAWLLAVAW
ncbi:MAG: hypothetical protein ACO1OB_28620 [Archangium sp.]